MRFVPLYELKLAAVGWRRQVSMDFISTLCEMAVSRLVDWGKARFANLGKRKSLNQLIEQTTTRALMISSSINLAEKFKNSYLVEELLAHRSLLDMKRGEAIRIFLGGSSDDVAYQFVEEFLDSVDRILSVGEESLADRKAVEGIDEANQKLDLLLNESSGVVSTDKKLQEKALMSYCGALAQYRKEGIVPRSLSWRDSKDNLTQFDLVKSNQSVLVFANPGMGKSELMRSVAADLARKWISGNGDRSPVLIDARGWFRQYSDLVEGSARELFGQATEEDKSMVRENLSHFCLIVDGLDEVRSDRDLLIAELARYIKGKEVRIICTSRFEEDCSRIGVDGVTLSGLSGDDILAYLGDNGIDSPRSVMYRFNELGRELMRNPLHLKCLVEYLNKSGDGEVPRNLAAIYGASVSTMIGAKVDPDGDLDALYLKQQLGSYALECLSGQCVVSCRGFLMERCNFSDARRIEEAGKASGLLVTIGGAVEFSHTVLQEYLAAFYLSNCDNATIRAFCERNSKNPLLNNYFQILCGCTDCVEKQALILDCFEESNLSLFMSCLRTRMNLSNEIEERLNKSDIEMIMRQALKTYTNISNRYLVKAKPYIPFWQMHSEPGTSICIEADYNAATTVIHIVLKEKSLGEESVLVRFSDGEQGPIMRGPKGTSLPLLSLRVSNRPEIHTYRIADLFGGIDCAREIAISMINDDLDDFFKSAQTVLREPVGMRVGFVEEALRRCGIKNKTEEDRGYYLSLRTCTAAELDCLLNGEPNRFITVDGINIPIGVLPYFVRMFEITSEDYVRYLPPEPDNLGKGCCRLWETYTDETFKSWCEIALSERERSYRRFVQTFMEELEEYLPTYADGPFALRVAIEPPNNNDGISDRRLRISWLPVETEADTEVEFVDSRFSGEFDSTGLNERARNYIRMSRLLGRPGLSFHESSMIGSVLLREKSYVDKEVRERIRKEVKTLFKLY